MDGRENESVRTENLKRDVVFRSKRGVRSYGQYGQTDSQPSVKDARLHAERRRRRIRDPVEGKVKKEESEIIRSRFQELHRLVFRFGGDFGNPSSDRRVVFLFKIEGSEGEKKYRPENGKNYRFGNAVEKIKNRCEYEVYEKENDVHRLKVNPYRRNEQERHGGENRERKPIAHLFRAKCGKRKRREHENERMLRVSVAQEFRNGKGYGINDGINEQGIREEIPKRSAKEKERFGIFRYSALQLHV